MLTRVLNVKCTNCGAENRLTSEGHGIPNVQVSCSYCGKSMRRWKALSKPLPTDLAPESTDADASCFSDEAIR